MADTIRESFEGLVKYKAKRMQQRKSYEILRRELLSEFKVTQLDDAFLLGAYDAMIYEMASTIGQAYMKPKFRKNLIKKILTKH